MKLNNLRKRVFRKSSALESSHTGFVFYWSRFASPFLLYDKMFLLANALCSGNKIAFLYHARDASLFRGVNFILHIAFVIRVRFTEAKSLTSIDAHMHRASIVSLNQLIWYYGRIANTRLYADVRFAVCTCCAY